MVKAGDKLLPVIPKPLFDSFPEKLDELLMDVPLDQVPRIKREVNRETQRGWVVPTVRDLDILKDMVKFHFNDEFTAMTKESVIEQRKVAKGISKDIFS